METNRQKKQKKELEKEKGQNGKTLIRGKKEYAFHHERNQHQK